MGDMSSLTAAGVSTDAGAKPTVGLGGAGSNNGLGSFERVEKSASGGEASAFANREPRSAAASTLGGGADSELRRPSDYAAPTRRAPETRPEPVAGQLSKRFKAIAAAEKSIAERAREADYRRDQWINAARSPEERRQRDIIATVADYEKESRAHVDANARDYPAIRQLGAHNMVPNLQAAYFQRTGQLVSPSAAARTIETYLRDATRRVADAVSAADKARAAAPSKLAKDAGPYERAIHALGGPTSKKHYGGR